MYGYYHSDMFIDSLNRIWFSYSDRIYKFNNGVWTEFPISGILGLPTNCGFKGMTMDKLGNLWLLVDHSNTFYGIAKFNGTNWGFIPHSSALPSIGKISCDAQNRIMVPLGTEGLHIFDGVNWSVDSASGGNITSITNAVSDNYGKIYAIDNNQNLFYRNGNSWVNFTSAKLISNTYNSTLLCDKNNNIYFGGEGNLIVYNSSPLGLNFSWDKSRIKGTVFYDGNQNKIEDSTETGLGGQKINLLPDSTTYFSSMNGDYSIPVDAGNHSISNVTQTNWTLTTDSSMYNFHIDTTDICCYNFGKYPTVFTDSLEAHITSFSRMRCGFDVSYAINYRNLGTNVNSGRLAMIKSDSLTFLTANPSPTSVSNDSLFWNFTNLNPGQERIIYLTCKVPLTSGLDICAKIVAQKYSAGNNYTTLYSDSSCSTVTCSFDPNEKEALPHGLYDQHYTIKKDALEYIIRFQNLGNDTAFNIIVKDTLSPKLNFSSFEVIGYSHPLTASINSKGIAEFRFTNIKLPNDEVNEPGSHGFVRYKMQPKQGLPDATKINNSAQIYFDFNAPIFTNNVFNTLVDSLNFIGINETNLIQNGIAIYPNPASDKLTISFRSKESRSYDIIDITGRIVSTGKLSENNSVLNVFQLIPSIYFIRIIGSKTNYSVKFMKQ